MSPKQFIDFKIKKTDSSEVVELKNLLVKKNYSIPFAAQIAGIQSKTLYRWIAGYKPNRVKYKYVMDKLYDRKGL